MLWGFNILNNIQNPKYKVELDRLKYAFSEYGFLILKNSPIILLDEATSSLDAESEEKVQNAVINLTKNKTTLVIAHRLSTIISADMIIVMNKGKIVDVGTHANLLKNSTVYKNLYSKQINA